MGLYLCVFSEEEIDGVEVGPYIDFNELRDYVARELEQGLPGSKFPTFINHSDSDGEWSVDDCVKLHDELSQIISAMKSRHPLPFASDWQNNVAKSIGLMPQNAFESFIDVDGEFVLERILYLVDVAIKNKIPILFQ
jgi:hypothetical protein